MNRREEIKNLIEEVEKYTLQYSAEMGVVINSNGFVSCLSPEHADRNPSCSWWAEQGVFHCFGCGEVFNIFKLAHIFEGKPASGPNFLSENLFYLAERYGLSYEHLQRDLTAEEIEEQQYYRVMEIFSEYVVKNKKKNYLETRGITVETADKLKIGSVKDYADCLSYLEKYNCSKEMVKEIGIESFKVNENKMIFIIKDEWGRPSSFVSREMEGTKNAPKYINGNRTVIFNKSRIFYGWSDIKKEFSNIASFSQLVILEGYIDFVSAYQRGLRNIVALGSASFTDDQISIIEKDRKIKKVAFALDHDTIGIKRTESIMTRIKQHSPTLKQYNFAIYKEVGKDVDEILKNEEIKKLSQIFNFMSLFEFELHTIKKNIGDDVDESQLFDRFVAVIAQSTKSKEREEQARALSKYLNQYSFATVLESVNEVVDGKQKFFNEEIKKRSMVAVREIEKSPKNADIIVESLKDDLEHIGTKYGVKHKTARERSISHFKSIEDDKSKEDSYVVDFKFPWLDDLDIMPGNSIIVSSLANTGKSTLFQYIVKQMSMYNPNAVILFATTDDPSQKVWQNLIASFSGLDRDYCLNPFFHKKWGINVTNDPKAQKMKTIYDNTSELLENLQETGKLVILDSTQSIDDWNELEKTMKEMDSDPIYKDTYKILIVDSVNNMFVDGLDENNTASFLSSHIKKASQKYNFLSFLNFELNKMKDNAKLSQYNISGSKKMFYNADVISFVYNPMRNLQEHEGTEKETKLYWNLKRGGSVIKQPILVTIQAKTKAGNNEMTGKPYFYELNTFCNIVNPIKPGSEEHNFYYSRWMAEWQTLYGEQKTTYNR